MNQTKETFTSTIAKNQVNKCPDIKNLNAKKPMPSSNSRWVKKRLNLSEDIQWVRPKNQNKNTQLSSINVKKNNKAKNNHKNKADKKVKIMLVIL